MRALIRNEGETVTQDMRLTFIDWDTGAPLTDSDWYGGPYTLVYNLNLENTGNGCIPHAEMATSQLAGSHHEQHDQVRGCQRDV